MSNVIQSEIKPLLDVYEELHGHLEQKKEVLTARRIDELGSLDEKIISLYNQIHKLADGKDLRPTEGERKVICDLAQKIQTVELTNQAIIKRSLMTLDNIFNGVLKVVGNSSSGYTKTGKASSKRDLGLSSIVEEA